MQTLNKQFKLVKNVYILGLCTDISKLLLGIVNHRCSDSVTLFIFIIVSITVHTAAHHRQEYIYPDFSLIPFKFPHFSLTTLKFLLFQFFRVGGHPGKGLLCHLVRIRVLMLVQCFQQQVTITSRLPMYRFLARCFQRYPPPASVVTCPLP